MSKGAHSISVMSISMVVPIPAICLVGPCCKRIYQHLFLWHVFDKHGQGISVFSPAHFVQTFSCLFVSNASSIILPSAEFIDEQMSFSFLQLLYSIPVFISSLSGHHVAIHKLRLLIHCIFHDVVFYYLHAFKVGGEGLELKSFVFSLPIQNRWVSTAGQSCPLLEVAVAIASRFLGTI